MSWTPITSKQLLNLDIGLFANEVQDQVKMRVQVVYKNLLEGCDSHSQGP